MGWADCGTDSTGRPIGYAHDAICDHPGCSAEIDRGLSYACGGEHGETEFGCENYFCGSHMWIAVIDDRAYQLCAECIKRAEDEDLIDKEDDDE